MKRWLLIALLLLLCVPVPSYSFCRNDLSLKEFFIVGPDYYNPTSQGMCVAGSYIIYTRYRSESSPTVYVIIDKQTGKEVAHYSFNTSHSNSLTYNPDKKEVVAVTNSKAYVFSFKGTTLEYKTTYFLNHNCPKIAYVQSQHRYYLGTSTVIFSTEDFRSLRAEFHVPQFAVNQGMGFDGRYLYIPWYRVGHNTVCVYDLNGREVKRYELVSNTYREIEDIDFDGDRMFLNIANSPGHNGISTVDSIHTYGKWQKVKKETCGDAGLKEHLCKFCQHSETAVIPPTGKHKPGKWKPTKSPTCTKPGGHLKRCKVCKQVVKEESVPATGHSYTPWKRIALPDVFEVGTDYRYCEKCGRKEHSCIPKLKPYLKVSEKYVLVRTDHKCKLSCSYNYGDNVKSWETSDKKIATVKNGIVYGKKRGECKIRLTLQSGLVKVIPVKVQFLPIFTDDLTVYKIDSMKVGETKKIEAHKYPSTAFNKIKVSSDSDNVEVDGLKLIAKSKGKAHIKVRSWLEVREFDIVIK